MTEQTESLLEAAGWKFHRNALGAEYWHHKDSGRIALTEAQALALLNQPATGATDEMVERVAVAIRAAFCKQESSDPDDYDLIQFHAEAKAALDILPILSQPPGFRLVPEEITLEMQKAYFDVIDRNMERVSTDLRFGRFESQKEAYRAMLAAAPKQEG